jgi:hypothetical protein
MENVPITRQKSVSERDSRIVSSSLKRMVDVSSPLNRRGCGYCARFPRGHVWSRSPQWVCACSGMYTRGRNECDGFGKRPWIVAIMSELVRMFSVQLLSASPTAGIHNTARALCSIVSRVRADSPDMDSHMESIRGRTLGGRAGGLIWLAE